MAIFGNPLASMPSAKLRDINKRWSRGEFINGLDPNFGDETAYTAFSLLENTIWGTKDTCPESGTADSITALLKAIGTPGNVKAKCALYKVSDSSKVAETEERTLSITTSFVWYTFNFATPKPSVENIAYYILAHGEPTACDITIAITSTAGSYKRCYAWTAYPTFPDPLSITEYDGSVSIYCSYTVVAPPAKPLINKPLINPVLVNPPIIR